MSEYTDEDILNTGSSITPQPNEWQVKRGYHPNKPNQNPLARFHANGKYATGKYKKWLEENNAK